MVLPGFVYADERVEADEDPADDRAGIAVGG